MALRRIRIGDDSILRKTAKKVEMIDDRIAMQLDDMLDTMRQENGVGLAGPQVGILKRLVVIDVGEGPVIMVNPRIISCSGEQTEAEGCLSVPNVFGIVKRPAAVTVMALDRKGKELSIEGTGLLARAIAHEIDHLDGILFTDKVIRYVDAEELNSK